MDDDGYNRYDRYDEYGKHDRSYYYHDEKIRKKNLSNDESYYLIDNCLEKLSSESHIHIVLKYHFFFKSYG